MNQDEQKGFDMAIERVLQLCEQQAKDYAKNRAELRIKRRESLPFHYKASAMLDFKLYLDQLFNMTLEPSE